MPPTIVTAKGRPNPPKWASTPLQNCKPLSIPVEKSEEPRGMLYYIKHASENMQKEAEKLNSKLQAQKAKV